MGVNLVPIVRNFTIDTKTFDRSSSDFLDGCVTPGTHRLLRFDTLVHNIGDTDLRIGAPSERPELFVFHQGHGHYHLRDFMEYLLLDTSGRLVTRGYKQSFCLYDALRIDSWARTERRFLDCNTNQGISAGWADIYRSGLPCQMIIIDGVGDGEYILAVTTNAQRIVPEQNFVDNRLEMRLKFQGDTVTFLGPVTPSPAPGDPPPPPPPPGPNPPPPPPPHPTPSDDVVLGEIRLHAGPLVPHGWASCDGQILHIHEHEGLYAIIGSTYGGDGEVTFALPDLRGRVPIHANESRRIGQVGGVATHALTIDEMPAHTHDLIASPMLATHASPRGALLAKGALSIDRVYAPPVVMSASLAGEAIGPTGNGDAHENMQPSLALHFIIALEGRFPTG